MHISMNFSLLKAVTFSAVVTSGSKCASSSSSDTALATTLGVTVGYGTAVRSVTSIVASGDASAFASCTGVGSAEAGTSAFVLASALAKSVQASATHPAAAAMPSAHAPICIGFLYFAMRSAVFMAFALWYLFCGSSCVQRAATALYAFASSPKRAIKTCSTVPAAYISVRASLWLKPYCSGAA